ncbi:MAG: gamma-glutamyltransferase [Pseudomonadota bacterium]
MSASAEEKALGPYNIPTDAYIVRYNDVFAPVVSEAGMVSSQNDIATRVGVEILNQGGSAIDASVAVGFALAVTLPRAGNLGGGGFMVWHDAESGKSRTIDFRETAPTGVRAADFLTDAGEKDRDSRFTWPAVGVPGTVAGMHKAWELGGSLPWRQLLAPALKLARDGFPVSYDLAEILASKRPWLTGNPATASAFYKDDGSSYAVGETMRRPDLAMTLEAIATKGPAEFYRGSIADRIVADMKRFGGHIDHEDLADYEAIVREPVRGTYRGYEIVAMPPPSSGGVAIIEILNILEGYPLGAWGYSARSLHVMAEAMKLTFADRGNYLADPAYFEVPVRQMIDKAYARSRAELIRMDRALPVDQIKGGISLEEGPSTTHYSIVDAAGNAVSNTYTLSSSFGAGLTVQGTGILLNNQIHTFSVRADVSGATGFIASRANRIEDGKRPVSSQSPTIVLKDGKPFLVVGSPGGSRIITAVVQTIVNVIDFDMNIAEATNQRRIHHQWIPDVLEVEPGFNVDTLRLLEELGHQVKVTATMGSTQSILLSDRYVFGASDPRRPNALSEASR